MERLTEWYDDGQQKGILVKEYPTENSMKTLYRKFGERTDYFDCDEGYLGMERLKAYEDAEEQGLLLRLPCKEVYSSSGDTVFYIFDYEIAECINCGVSMDCEGKLWIALACDEHIFPYRNPDPEHDLDPTDWCINSTQVTIDEWGKTVFITREEAEQALKQMGE
jgi:hypothetical protein